MQEKLQELGLSKNDSQVYVFLLKHGSTTTGSIISETGISNSRVYASLDSLIDRGLVSYTVQKDGKHFKAQDPNRLFEHEHDRMEKLKELVPQLESIQNVDDELTSTAVYEGFSGFRTAFAKIIDECPQKGTIRILGFSEQAYANDSLRMFIKNMNLRSADKKQKLKLLLGEKTRNSLGADRESESYSEVRYMPEGYISPAAIDITDDAVYMFLWEEKPFVFAIRNRAIAKSFQTYFEFLWSLSTE